MTRFVLAVAAFAMCAVALVPADRDYEFTQNVKRNYVRDVKSGSIAHALNQDGAGFIRTLFPNTEFIITDHYTTKHNGITHTYMKQVVNGLEVQNSDINVNVNSNGEVVSFGERIFHGSTVYLSTLPKLSAEDAIHAFCKYLELDMSEELTLLEQSAYHFKFSKGGVSLDDISVQLRYLYTEGEKLELSWEIILHTDFHWFVAMVSARSGEVLALYDWTHFSSYNVYPIGVNDPSDGSRSIETDPHLESTGSRLGWHDSNSQQYTNTIGNNVDAYENASPTNPVKGRAEGGASLSFDFPIDLSQQPVNYQDASITNLFYWNNIVHDVFYQYGFDEVSGNFQSYNFGLGGKENDEVEARCQDGTGMNNAMFSTPPDGSSGVMRMFLWTASPNRDGSLDNGIIIHEYGHGISIRLTGGPNNSNCMSGGQSGGMGEGWGDCWSLMFRWRQEYNVYNTNFEMGDYAAGYGIRKYPYAWNMTDNPQTYETINQRDIGSSVHAMGCVWCSMVYNVYQLMIDRFGFDADLYSGKGGNNILLQDMVDALKLQPCLPDFIETRDALLLANEQNFNGQHKCTYWEGFARRGLGVGASNGAQTVDDFTVPAECQ